MKTLFLGFESALKKKPNKEKDKMKNKSRYTLLISFLNTISVIPHPHQYPKRNNSRSQEKNEFSPPRLREKLNSILYASSSVCDVEILLTFQLPLVNTETRLISPFHLSFRDVRLFSRYSFFKQCFRVARTRKVTSYRHRIPRDKTMLNLKAIAVGVCMYPQMNWDNMYLNVWL